MPEGPEVYCSTKILNNALAQLYITDVNFTDYFYKNGDLELNKHLPLKIEEICSRAKRVNFICENSEGDGSALIFFYAMQGRLCFEHRGRHMIEFIISEKNENGDFVKVNTLYYEDDSRLGFVKYCTTSESINNIYKDIGPDFTVGDVTLEMFKSQLNSKRIKNKLIGLFLLEQKRFSGIGNYLRAEMLYCAKISPFRELQKLSEIDKEILFYSINKIMKLAVSTGGLTSRNYLDPNSEKGKFEAVIYNQKTVEHSGKMYNVISEKIGKKPKGSDTRRTIHWCPKLQI